MVYCWYHGILTAVHDGRVGRGGERSVRRDRVEDGIAGGPPRGALALGGVAEHRLGLPVGRRVNGGDADECRDDPGQEAVASPGGDDIRRQAGEERGRRRGRDGGGGPPRTQGRPLSASADAAQTSGAGKG